VTPVASAATPRIPGALDVDGDAGVVTCSTGSPGAIVSSTYGNTPEHEERFPAASIVSARRLLVPSASALVKAITASPRPSAVPVPRGTPVQGVA
jgi:hypothetical protein